MFRQRCSPARRASVRVGDLLLMIGRIRFVRHDLGAAEAGGLALLAKPAAGGPDPAGGQRVDHRRNAFNDPLRQAAGVIPKMLAAAARAGGCDTEQLRRLGRSR